jgi:hypothetical protein
MILSRQKQNFVLDKAIEAINTSHDYDMDNMSFSKTFHLKYESLRGNSYKIRLYFYQNVLSKVTLYRQGGDVEIDLDGNDIKFRTIESLMYNKVKEIDDIKFKKIFPEYDIMEERNDILDELLKEEEVKEVEVVKEEVKKRKWFNMFS